MTTILFARSDSIYKTMPGCDVWDERRDALNWPGGTSIVAHPPCRLWGRLSQFSKAPPFERVLGIYAVWITRRYGGVLEHPANSTLWQHMNMPLPGQPADQWGGYTIEINQCDFGHVAEKRTWLYVVRGTLPVMPARRMPTHVVKPSARDDPATRLPICTHKWREATPLPLAEWLVCVARSVVQ